MVNIDDLARRFARDHAALEGMVAELAGVPDNKPRRRSRVAQRIGEALIAHHIECEQRLWPCVQTLAPTERGLTADGRDSLSAVANTLWWFDNRDRPGSAALAEDLSQALGQAFDEERQMLKALREATTG